MSDTMPDSIILGLNGYMGVRKVHLRGRNAAISNSAETIWGPGATYTKLTTAVAFEAVSSSANDTAAGTGARTIRVELVDGNYLSSTVTVTLAGATPVAITGTFLACNSLSILTAGSGGTNAGTVDIRAVSGGAIQREMTTGATLGLGLAADFIYTIPAGKTGLLMPVNYGATTVTGDLTVYLNTITSAGVLKNMGADKSSLYVTGFNGARGQINFGAGLIVPSSTFLELRAIVTAGVGDLVAIADLYVVNNGAGWGTG